MKIALISREACFTNFHQYVKDLHVLVQSGVDWCNIYPQYVQVCL